MKMMAHILFFVILATAAQAQNAKVLQMVKRVVPAEQYRFQNEFLLEINAEKANIEVRVVSGHTVTLHMEQSAMNADVRVAERELAYCHFVAKKERNRLYLNNYVQLEAGSKSLSSIINNKYVLEVPSYCHLKIKNELGEVSVKGLHTSMRFDLQYSSLNLEDIRGKVYIDSRIGDVVINKSQLNAEFILENVDLKLYECGGSYDVQSQFGSLSCTMSDQISILNANLEHCEATLINRTTLDFNYAVTTNKAQISVLDEELKLNVVEDEDKETLRLKKENSVGTVIIKSTYGDVNLY